MGASMAGVGLFVEVAVKPELQAEFLAATRLYRFRTQHEPGVSHCQVLKSADTAGAFVLYTTFLNATAVERHFASAHAKQWIDAVSHHLTAPIAVRRTEIAIGMSDPPPLPKKPVIESSSSFAAWDAGRRTTPEPAVRPAQAPRLKLPRLEVVVEEMEFAAATDGLLRGMPDPCFLLACYDIDGQKLPLGRVIYRFTLEDAAPCAMRGAERLLDLAVPYHRLPLRCLFLLLAFEENGGADVTRMYQELGRSEGLLIWGSEQTVPNPLSLSEYADSVESRGAQRVQILCHDTEVPDTMRDDTWVGAGAALVQLRQGQESLLHFHVCSPDRGNDWMMRLSLRFS